MGHMEATMQERYDAGQARLEAASRIAVAIIQRVAELSDRTSPDDQPDMMLVTADELHLIIVDEMSQG